MNHPKLPRLIHLDPILYTNSNSIYSFTIQTNNSISYFRNLALGLKLIECLKESRDKDNCYVACYCFMPDHLHLVCGPKTDGISVLTFIDRFKGRSTRISWDFGVKRILWQKRNYDHIIRHNEDLDAQISYILNNSVRKEMVNKWEDYPLCGYLDSLPF